MFPAPCLPPVNVSIPIPSRGSSTGRALALLGALIGATTGCSDDTTVSSDAGVPLDGALNSDAGTGGLTSASPALETTGACDGIAGAAMQEAPTTLDSWSELHTQVRFFADHADPFTIDAALVTALGGEAATRGSVDGSEAAFDRYVQEIPGLCRTGFWPASQNAETQTPTSTTDGVQWLAPRPGFSIAEGTTHLLVDLRSAPEGTSLERFLNELATVTLGGELELPLLVRVHQGMRDEAFSPRLGSENQYHSVISREQLTASGTADGSLKVGLLLGDRIAPSAARFALLARHHGQVTLLGNPLRTSVAEQSTVVAGEGAVHFRSRHIESEAGVTFPDAIPADIAFDSGEQSALEAAFLGFTGTLGPIAGEATRESLRIFPRRTEVVATERHEGGRQASLLAAHGAAKLFFPYWDVVPAGFDERLAQSIAFTPAESESEAGLATRSLGYLSHGLHDSHGFIFFFADPPPPGPFGTLPVNLDTTADDEAVIRTSNHPEFSPGDIIVSIDGTPASELRSRALQFRASSASSAARNSLGGLRFLGDAARQYELRGPDGTVRTVSVSRSDVSGLQAPNWPERTFGPVEGHPEILYINLDGARLMGRTPELIEAINGAESLILDSRSYPAFELWEIVRHLLYDGAPGVPMVEFHRSILGTTDVPSPQPWMPRPGGFRGEVVMISAPTTQSQAEHLILSLQSGNRVRVVGRPSAGANGNITCLALPGNYAFCFTGMVVLQPDRSTFHGLGVRVDEPVPVIASELATDSDPELTRAIELLTAP